MNNIYIAGGADANRYMRGLTMASIEEYAKKRIEREKARKVALEKAALEQEERKRQRKSVRGKRLTDKSNADAAAFGMSITATKSFSPIDVTGKQPFGLFVCLCVCLFLRLFVCMFVGLFVSFFIGLVIGLFLTLTRTFWTVPFISLLFWPYCSLSRRDNKWW